MALVTRGFTVLEMMVVLIIISMALTLGFQSLGQWQIAEAALDRMAATTRAQALVTDWWTASMRGLAPVEQQPFKGSADRLDGFTLAPVFSQPGAMTPIRWSIVESSGAGAALQLDENGTRRVLPLTGARQARFRYLSEEGKVSDAWPSESLGLEGTDLPAYVELVIEHEDGREDAWLAHVVGPLEPYYKPFREDD